MSRGAPSIGLEQLTQAFENKFGLGSVLSRENKITTLAEILIVSRHC